MRAWRMASIAMAAIFVVIIYESLSLPLLDKLGPGPGFFPLCLSILGLVLAALLFLEGSRAGVVSSQARPGEPSADVSAVADEEGGWFRPLSVLFLIAAVAALLNPPFELIGVDLPGLGFRPVALLFITVLLLALGIRNPVTIVLFAVLGSFGVFHVFNNLLKVILPVGAFGI